MTTVPLVIYDSLGNRTVIGTADVSRVGGEFVVVGRIADPSLARLGRDANLGEAPSDYSIGFQGSIPVEAAQYPEPFHDG